MPRNSSGTYALPAGNPVVTNTLIQSTWANTTLSDVSTAMTDSLDRNGRGAMLAPLKNVDGTAVAPALSFSSEGTLGIYRAAAGVLGFAVGGALVLSLSATGLTFTTPIVLPIGSAAAPSLTFVSNTNTGIYSPATNQVAITTNGVQRVLVDATGNLSITGNATVSGGTLNLAFAGANLVQASNAAGSLTFQTGGANTRMTIDSAGLVVVSNGATFNAGLTLPNGIAISWKDGGGTARAAIELNGSNFIFGDVFDAVAGSTALMRADSSMSFQIAATTILNVNGSGAGVGVVPSAWGASSHALQLGTAAALNGLGSTTILSNNFYNNGAGNIYLTNSFASAYTQSAAGAHLWQGAPSGVAGNTVTLTTLMQLTTAGLLGIGMTPSTNKLEIAGSASTLVSGALDTSWSANVNGVLAMALGANNSGSTNSVGAVTGSNYVGSVGGPMVFTTAAAERMRIDTSGNAGIGTTSPGARLHARSDVAGGTAVVAMLDNGAGGGGTNVAELAFANGGSIKSSIQVAVFNNDYMTFNVGANVERVRIDAGGNVGIGKTPATYRIDLTTAAGQMMALDSTNANSGFVAFTTSGTAYGYIGNAKQVIASGVIADMALRAEAALQFTSGGANAARLTITSAGVVQDAVAELGWKDIPANSQSGAYVLVLADRGKQILITTGGVTVPQSIFAVGNVVTIVNNSGTSQTITQGVGVTMHQAGTTNTGNRTLLPWGIATVLCIGSSVFAISGNLT